MRISTFIFSILPHKKSNFKSTVLFLEQLPEEGAGYNYRVKKWMDLFNSNNLSTESMSLVVKSNDFFRRISERNLPDFTIQSGFKRYFQIIKARKYQTVIVRRAVLIYNDYGNLFMEKLLRKVHPNILLDFDDDIATNRKQAERKSFFERVLLDNSNRFNESFHYYDRFIVGSDFLKKLVLERKPSVSENDICIIPTCVDYTDLEQKKYTNTLETITFGWIGGNHNLPLIKEIIPALNEFSKSDSIQLNIISGVKHYDFGAQFPVQFIQYSLETELEHLRQIDIGLMPLSDDAVSRGKCGFKLIQYMGLGIPSVATNITVNADIIDHNKNGWLVEPNTDWLSILEEISSKKNEFDTFGLNAQQKIDKSYSFKAHLENYMSFIRKQDHHV